MTVEDGAPVVRFGNLWAVATPFTRPETMRIELIPNRGKVLAFELKGGRARRALYDGEAFERTE